MILDKVMMIWLWLVFVAVVIVYLKVWKVDTSKGKGVPGWIYFFATGFWWVLLGLVPYWIIT